MNEWCFAVCRLWWWFANISGWLRCFNAYKTHINALLWSFASGFMISWVNISGQESLCVCIRYVKSYIGVYNCILKCITLIFNSHMHAAHCAFLLRKKNTAEIWAQLKVESAFWSFFFTLEFLCQKRAGALFYSFMSHGEGFLSALFVRNCKSSLNNCSSSPSVSFIVRA